MSETSTPITVTALTSAIKNQLEPRFAHLTVQGEISNAKMHSSGHLYFDLKDADAKIGAVMFRPQCQTLKRPPKEGDQVIVQGGLSVYPPHGKYQMIVRSLDYMGIGELLLKLEALKKKLHALGWFDKEKKKPLPKFPQTIGVVTSPTGAVIRDIITVLSRRSPGFHLILYPVRVQGAEAPLEIAKAIQDFNTHRLADVLIVGRGGGSLEDLWAFNEESVAKAIFESAIPVVSAVGHETDVTIADFVADLRAPTPSAAAEIVSAETAHHLEFLSGARKNLAYTLSHHLKRVRTQLAGYVRHPLFATSYALCAAPMQRLDEIKLRLDEKMQNELLRRRYLLSGRQKQQQALKPTAQIAFCRTRLAHLEKRGDDIALYTLNMKRQKLKEVVQRLQAVDPKIVLKRGYSILFAENGGSVIVSALEVSPGQKLRALLADGEVKVEVVDGTRI
ncbi:exodeoxyribonuclease VII large subunit [Chlamydiota bacterium]